MPTMCQINQYSPNADIQFYMHMEALFNMLLTTINRPWGNKILWRYKDLKVWYNTDLLPIDTHQSLNTNKDCSFYG